MAMRIGYKASAEQFAPGELAAFAVRAEELGLDSVTISDHFQPWRLTGGHAPNSIAWLAYQLIELYQPRADRPRSPDPRLCRLRRPRHRHWRTRRRGVAARCDLHHTAPATA